MVRWIGRLTVLLTVLGTALGTAGPAHAYVAGQDRLAFVRFDGTDASVQTMAYDGSAPKAPLKANGASMPRFVAASLSTDGTKLIYARLPNPNFSDLYVKTIGGGTRRLTRTPTITETSPAWSPNGKRIAYLETDHATYASLVVAKADGTHAVPIVTMTTDYIWYPSWSPDGTEIAFSTSDGSDEEIYVTTPAGAPPTQLTDNAVNDFAGDWSQDGKRIAFTRVTATGPVPAFGSRQVALAATRAVHRPRRRLHDQRDRPGLPAGHDRHAGLGPGRLRPEQDPGGLAARPRLPRPVLGAGAWREVPPSHPHRRDV